MQRGSDYDELLRNGYVAVWSDDPEGWRAAIKANARADKIKVRTGAGSNDAWAYLKVLDEREASLDELRVAMRQMEVVEDAFQRASLHGHLIRQVLRGENGRAAAVCPNCSARLYVDTMTSPPFMEGEVFEQDCPAAAFRS